MCLAAHLAAGHCEIAPRAPRAVLLPEFSGLGRGIARRRDGPLRGGIASIRPVHHAVTILVTGPPRKRNRTTLGKIFPYSLNRRTASETWSSRPVSPIVHADGKPRRENHRQDL